MNTEPSWDLYRTFLAVLEAQSLSGAARRLGLTQPTVSRHIDMLEAALGYDLFLRSQRGLAATEAALQLRPYAEAMASTSAALIRAATGHRDRVSGTVRVSCSEVFGVEHLPPVLAGLRAAYPELEIELVLTNAVEDLLRREADVAVRMTEPVQGALVARHLGAVPLGLHAHRSYLERRGTPRSLADLADHDVIGFDEETPALRTLLRSFPQFSRSAFALRASSDLAQLAMIRAGCGIGACQVPVARRSPELVHLLREEFAIDLGMWVVMHEDMKTSPRCRAVFDALVKALGPLGR